MSIVVSVILAGLFVFLAGFNVWNMLTNPGMSTRRSSLWTQIHRVAGYAFIALFVILCYFMFLRVKGWSDELPARLILHMVLALSLAPLLLVKVIVARYQKAARDLLMALGIGIFTIAFSVVAPNLFVHYLRVASSHKVPVGTSAIVIVVLLMSVAIAFYVKGKQRKPKPVDFNQSAGPTLIYQDEPLNLTLARIEPQTDDAKVLRFLLPRGLVLPTRPGQFLTFDWMIDGKSVTRSYSICSSPLQTGYIEITPKRVKNGHVSRFLNDHAKVGLAVKARGPYGRFCFEESKHERIVLIAGGSGVTPMIAMLRYIDDLCIPVNVTLVYCARAQEDVFFNNDLSALKDRLIKFHYVLVLSQPSSDWTGWRGYLRREILEREVEKALESTFFLCGPPGLMELSRSLLKEMRVESSRILQESFGGAVARERDSAAIGGPLEIRFSRSGVSYSASPEQTLLESSDSNGLLIPSGCRQGSCGTCATKLLNGKVQMETEEALNDELRSEGFILPCVSRPLSDITLDA